MRASRLLLASLLLLSCTDASLYSNGPAGDVGNRAAASGQICMPLTEGAQFPVKVIFAVEGGQAVTLSSVDYPAITSALGSIANRFNGAAGLADQFELVAYSAIATGLLGTFGSGAALNNAVTQYGSFTGAGPVSMRSALLLAQTLVQGDMETSCPGTLGRTRYVVVLIGVDPDTSCANPVFNPNITPQCSAFESAGDDQACETCELTKVTEQVMALGPRYGAGQVTVQPIYIYSGAQVGDGGTAPPAEIQAIAQAGGSQPVVVSPQNLNAAVNQVNYTSLQPNLVPRAFIAFNRQVRAIAGLNQVDSDGDGLPDALERQLGLDPQNPDTDGDGLMDGVEVKAGLDPKTPNVIQNCNALLDTDNDGLNDCEELVLGTSSCTGDTDGDGLPDLVEFLSGTNPLVPEGDQDTDGDGVPNFQEVVDHTDPLTADLAFRSQYAYGYGFTNSSQSTPDGRTCYNVGASNVSLMQTLAAKDPNHPNLATDAGTNQVYLYFQVGRPDVPNSQGANERMTLDYTFFEPNKKTPSGTVSLTPDQFKTGI
jgi:hypothetical protein